MKIDLTSVDLALLDVSAWDLEVWVCVMLATQAFAFLMWIRRDMKRASGPVESLARRRHFGI